MKYGEKCWIVNIKCWIEATGKYNLFNVSPLMLVVNASAFQAMPFKSKLEAGFFAKDFDTHGEVDIVETKFTWERYFYSRNLQMFKQFYE